MKICSKCGEEKDSFYKDKAAKSGFRSICKDCDISRRIAWSLLNKDKDLISKNKYIKNNLDKVRKSRKQLEIHNPGYDAKKAKEYRERLGSVYNEKIRKRDKERRSNDSLYAIKRRISGNLYSSIVKRGFKKKSKSNELLGCNYNDFKLHIELQFNKNMTWANYGKAWTYDHICPSSQAQNEQELIKLQHYSNWRPYEFNFQKSDSKTSEGIELCIKLLNRGWVE